MNIDLVSIVAASALIIPTAATLVLWAANRQKAKRIKQLESTKKNLSEILAERSAQYLDMVANEHDEYIEKEEALRMAYDVELSALRSQITVLEGHMMAAELAPLGNVSDEDLGHVVQKEVTKRVKLARQASLPWGNTAHKLATKVGGACFRVVDHCKRGHGEFQDYGPYAAPLVGSTAELED